LSSRRISPRLAAMRRTKFTINGPKVSEMRDERGWSMTQFAAEVGVSYGYVPLAAIVAGEPVEVA
jgi:DNA-binding transcriptional regulator YiaG